MEGGCEEHTGKTTSRADEGQTGLLRPWTRVRWGPRHRVWPPSPGPAVLPQTWHGQGGAMSGKACPGVHSPAPRSRGSGGPCPGSRRGCARSPRDVPPVPPGWGTRPAGAREGRSFRFNHPCPCKAPSAPIFVLLLAGPDATSSLLPSLGWAEALHTPGPRSRETRGQVSRPQASETVPA